MGHYWLLLHNLQALSLSSSAVVNINEGARWGTHAIGPSSFVIHYEKSRRVTAYGLYHKFWELQNDAHNLSLEGICWIARMSKQAVDISEQNDSRRVKTYFNREFFRPLKSNSNSYRAYALNSVIGYSVFLFCVQYGKILVWYGDLFMLRLLRMIFYHNIQTTDCYRSQNLSWRKGGEIALIKA